MYENLAKIVQVDKTEDKIAGRGLPKCYRHSDCYHGYRCSYG